MERSDPARSSSSIELDPQRYEQQRKESLYRLHVVRNPIYRFVGFLAVALAILLHNQLFLGIDAFRQAPSVLALYLVYPLLSWALLWQLYRDHEWLSDLVLTADLVMMVVAVYLSGGELSLLFFLPLFRVIDQVHTNFRRALNFALAAVAAYLLMVLYLRWGEGRELDWGAEGFKLAVLYTGVLYTALTARGADRSRRRTENAIRLAQQSIDALQEAQRELRRVMHRNELILQSAGESIVGVDLEGRVIFVNERGASRIGKRVEDVVGRRGHDVAPHAAADGRPCDGVDCPIEAAIRSGREEHGQSPGFYGPDGRTIPVEFTSAPMREDGELCGAVFTFRDISERLRMQSEILAAKEAAEKASQAKSQFLANMSHELRTPLNAILGYSEMLQEEIQDAGAQDLLPDLHRIASSGRHLLALIDDVLEIARLETGSVELQLDEFSVDSLLTEVERSIHPVFENSSNRLEVQHDSHGTLQADFSKLRRILLSLLGNANKFTENGRVRLSVDRRNDPERSWTLFRITDTGIGMEPEQVQRIFEPFSQGDETYTRRYGGTGSGLTIARRLAQTMGGEIEVESTPGVGSVFTVRVPT